VQEEALVDKKSVDILLEALNNLFKGKNTSKLDEIKKIYLTS
jgi:hypothetical protein